MCIETKKVSCSIRSYCHCWLFIFLQSFITCIDYSPPKKHSFTYCTFHSIRGTLCSIKSQFIFLQPRTTKCVFSFSSHHSKKYLLLYIKHALIKCWCEEKGQSIVWRIYSICIRNCVQFTNSLFYNLVHLTAAGGQIMVGLEGSNTGPRWTPNMMQSTKMMIFVCLSLKSQISAEQVYIIIRTQKKV